MTNFGGRLQELLDEKNINVLILSKALKISNSNIYACINHDYYPRTEILIKIADYFNCSLDFLLGRVDEDKKYTKHERIAFPEVFRKALFVFHKNINQVSVGTGLHTTLIYRWLNCKSRPSTESLIRLADFFGCSVDFLLGFER